MKVVGITGTIGSGKSLVRNILRENFDSYHVLLSDILKKRAGKFLERKNLQDFGNELRAKYGAHILAEVAVENLPEGKELIIIDGIRNPAEIEFLRKKFGKDFKLIGVDAPIQVRFERVVKRKYEHVKTFREFLKLNERDLGKGEPEYGQQVEKCLKQADFLIINDGTIEDLRKKVEEIVKKLKGQ